jgi:ribosomal protein L37AE/L43A
MGFFDSKEVCGICGKETGLNRFKIKQSNAWICSDCAKKAGGVMSFNVSKITIEEIKERINDLEEKQKVKQDNIISNPMKTAEGMYQYCFDNNFGQGMTKNWGIKHFELIENSLMKDEEILMTFIGLHNYISMTKHDSNFAYAVTNKRMIMAQKKVIGERFQTVSLDNVNDITFTSGVVFGVMTVDTIKEKFNICLDKISAKKINEKIHEVLESLKRISSDNSITKSSNISTADEIKKYKGLLDMGAITQEEFDAKKKGLLNL